jgi:hypothetical protein
MRWLGSSVHDNRRPKLSNKIDNALPIPYVELMVLKAGKLPLKAVLIPPGVTLRSKENCALVVVNTVNFVADPGKICAYFTPDQPR